MNIKTVLVHVGSSRHQETTTRAAIRIAEKFAAALTGCYVLPNAALALTGAGPDGMVAPQVISDMQAEADERAAAAEKRFRDQLRAEGREAQWTLVNAEGSSARPALAREARYADVIVAGQSDPEEPMATDGALASDLLLDAGRPVILVPRGGMAEPIGESILLGWNDSREAARAMLDALPFLVRAKTVAVVEAVSRDIDPDGPAPGSRAAEFLRKHGVNARADPIAGVADGDVADALLSRAASMRADMIVMGGYSHSRLREGLFGGVTRDMMARATVPTLMSH